MKQTYYRICPACGNQNAADANFCLKCGGALSSNDEYAIMPHSSDQTFPLFDLELTPDEVAMTKTFMITSAPAVPVGYRSAGLVFAESDVIPRSGVKAMWESMMKNLYVLLLTKQYAGVVNVKIQPEMRPAEQLCLYAEAIVQDRQ